MKHIITFRREDESDPKATFECEGTYHDAFLIGNKKRYEVQNSAETLIMSIIPCYTF